MYHPPPRSGQANAKSEYAVPQIISQVYIGSFSPKATDASAKWSLMARAASSAFPRSISAKSAS